MCSVEISGSGGLTDASESRYGCFSSLTIVGFYFADEKSRKEVRHGDLDESQS